MDGSELSSFYDNLEKLNEIINDDTELSLHFDKYVKENGGGRNSFILNKSLFYRRLYRFFIPYRLLIDFLHSSKSIYGVINSDSHREILLSYLKNKIS